MKTKLFIFLFLTASIIPNLLFAQFTQQGPKLVGTGGIGSQYQGYSVAISSEGTLIEGGFYDNSQLGASWVFTRSGSVWTQQGSKLVGTAEVGNGLQGSSVAISSDGNTAIEGGLYDNNGVGAIWVFTRSGAVWTQQGNKLVGSGAVGSSHQGKSVAISSDGNTVVEGGYDDGVGAGAVWVFTRSNGVWTQQGSKLVGTGAVGSAVNQGNSVAISADGNTVVEGGYNDGVGAGAVWVFTRSGGVWTQQGPKLVGTGAVGGDVEQGSSVAISSIGNTVIVGGYLDNTGVGAVWIFTRSSGVWTQQGPKLIGTGASGLAHQGSSVAISADGNTSIEGGYVDATNTGALWVFTRSGGIWTQQGSKLVGTVAVGNALQGSSVAISSDGTFIEGGPENNSTLGAVWVFYNPTLSITPISNEVPKDFSLSQNYPNPFNPSTKIRFDIPAGNGRDRSVQLRIYDVLGREVSTLVNQQLQPGTYEVNFDATNFESGVYFYKLQTESFSETKKMILIK